MPPAPSRITTPFVSGFGIGLSSISSDFGPWIVHVFILSKLDHSNVKDMDRPRLRHRATMSEASEQGLTPGSTASNSRQFVDKDRAESDRSAEGRRGLLSKKR